MSFLSPSKPCLLHLYHHSLLLFFLLLFISIMSSLSFLTLFFIISHVLTLFFKSWSCSSLSSQSPSLPPPLLHLLHHVFLIFFNPLLLHLPCPYSLLILVIPIFIITLLLPLFISFVMSSSSLNPIPEHPYSPDLHDDPDSSCQWSRGALNPLFTVASADVKGVTSLALTRDPIQSVCVGGGEGGRSEVRRARQESGSPFVLPTLEAAFVCCVAP